VAIKKEMNECAAKYFKMAAERPGAPYYTALLASQLDDSQEACEVLMAMYLKEHRDPATRANIQGRLRDSSCGLSLLEEAERNQASFGRLRESVAPYVGDDLLVHIAPSAINRQGWLLDQEAEGSGDERE
jgi:hypothetical protein